MTCMECDCCKKGWFKSKPSDYVCIGVKEPFIIGNINNQCTEYPEHRNTITIEDAIAHFKYGISHDIFSEPVTSYAKMAIEALEKQIPKNVVSDGNDSDDWVYCPYCKEILGTNESVYNSFYENNWEHIYCHKCGHKLSWK